MGALLEVGAAKDAVGVRGVWCCLLCLCGGRLSGGPDLGCWFPQCGARRTFDIPTYTFISSAECLDGTSREPHHRAARRHPTCPQVPLLFLGIRVERAHVRYEPEPEPEPGRGPCCICWLPT